MDKLCFAKRNSMAQLMFVNIVYDDEQVVAICCCFLAVTKSQNSFSLSLFRFMCIFGVFFHIKRIFVLTFYTCAVVRRTWCFFSCSFYIWAIIQIICCGKIYYKLHNNHKNERIFFTASNSSGNNLSSNSSNCSHVN